MFGFEDALPYRGNEVTKRGDSRHDVGDQQDRLASDLFRLPFVYRGTSSRDTAISVSMTRGELHQPRQSVGQTRRQESEAPSGGSPRGGRRLRSAAPGR